MDAVTGAAADVPKTRENLPSRPDKLTINTQFSGFDKLTDNVVSPSQPDRNQSFHKVEIR